MTAQRFVRGGKARVVIGVCLVLLAVGVIFHYENTVSQLDNIKKSYDICTQQQESLSIQLQVIVDYKSRLEKSLQSEKAEHKQTRAELEARVNDEKLRRDKTSIEANLRFSSLQQNYNLLQAKHDDQKEKSDKLHQQYRDETDKLQAKVKELQEQIKQFDKDKEKSLEHLKTEYMQMQIDKKKLEEHLKGTNDQRNTWESKLNHLEKENKQLQRENDKLKRGSNIFDKLPAKSNEPDVLFNQHTKQPIVTTPRNFAKQIEIGNNVYQIQDIKNSPLDVANHDVVELENAQQIDAPKLHQNHIYEAHNIENNVLQKPKFSSKSTVKASSPSNGVLAGAQPLLLPTVTSSTKSTKLIKNNPLFDNSLNVLLPPNNLIKKVKVPDGVVPIPEERLQKNDELAQKIEKTEEKNIPDEIKLALPNRYRNNILESELDKEKAKETKVENKKPNNNNIKKNLYNEPEVNGGDINNQDNAMEVIDQPKNQAQDESLHLMDINQNLDTNNVKAQEVEQVIRDPMPQHPENRKFKKQHIDMLQFADRPHEAVVRAPPGGAIYEGEGDYDKDGHKEDLQLEEQEPEGEEDDDADDYDGHLAARQKDPAVRN